MSKTRPFNLCRAAPWTFAALLLSVFTVAAVSVPPPEKLLPDDTLLVLSVPDSPAFNAAFDKSAAARFWQDPAMRLFREDFVTKLKEQIVEPLGRNLGVRFGDYTNLVQGQLTFALTQNGWQGAGRARPGVLFLADVQDKTNQLKKNLTELRKKWADADKTVRTEKIRGAEFSVLMFDADRMPGVLKNFFAPEPRFQHLEGMEDAPLAATRQEKKASSTVALYVGQAGSLLIMGNASGPIERVLMSLGGGQAPTLADQAVFRANRQAFFRDAHFFGWANVKVLVDVLTRAIRANTQSEEPDADVPFGLVDPAAMISAAGLGGVRAVCLSVRDSAEGSLCQFFVDVPAANRTGIFKILAGEPKDATPPDFVPANVISFSRWRVDAGKAWATLEDMFSQIPPLSALSYFLEKASEAVKETDPDFELKKNIIGNLGDDFISYQKVPRSSDPADLRSPPSVVLLGSPRAEQLVGSIKTLFTAVAQASDSVTEREFLGKKIYSVEPRIAGGLASTRAQPRKLNFAASSGYVAFSTDAAALEEFLRTEGRGKALRETPGLAEASQKVISPGTSMFQFENQAEQIRMLFAALKLQPGSAPKGFSPAARSPFPGGDLAGFEDMMNFSLLPPYEKVARYFSFSVSALSASVDGITLKMFTPMPPHLRE